jgi:DNA invertase Pin-like site-specific DNA recombinase
LRVGVPQSRQTVGRPNVIGLTLGSRTGLANALTLLRSNNADGITVYRLDRLARDLIIQEQLLAEARQHGWHVFSTSTSVAAYLEDDPGDPSRKMIRQVLGAVAEYERSMIALRLRSGRARKAQRGGFAGGRTALRVLGDHRNGKSLRSIARTLNAQPVEF